MQVYLDLVILLNFLVDFLLIIGTNRLAGYPAAIPKALLAAAFGAGYAAVCMLRGFSFLADQLWRMVSLAVMSLIAFGCNRGCLRRGVLLILLSMALGGVAMGFGSGGFAVLILSAAAVALMCVLGFRGKAGSEAYDLVTLYHNGKKRELIALHDTGNSLTDPVTGENVMIVGADIAWEILGLTKEQLSDPITTMQNSKIPGLRLIPYRAVGKSNGMLLALRLDEVQINRERSGRIVAFAPEEFGSNQVYQALTGGVI